MDALPHLNALLNASATFCLLRGYACIRRRQETRHKRWMLSAFALSCLFLASYLLYHYQAGHVEFRGSGPGRTAYLALLASHVVLAALVPFLALRVLWLAFRDRRPAHRRLARWTFPLWLYVSATGVLIWFLLYPLGLGERSPAP